MYILGKIFCFHTTEIENTELWNGKIYGLHTAIADCVQKETVLRFLF